MSEIELNEYTVRLFSSPPQLPNTVSLNLHNNDQDLETIFNILIRIALSGIFILYINGIPWNNNDKYLGIKLTNILSDNSLETVNRYLKSIGFIAKLDITESEVENQKLSMCVKDNGRYLSGYHGYIVQDHIDYDIYFDIYLKRLPMFNVCGMEDSY